MTAAQVVAPFLGAILIEVVHWYQLRSKLHLKRYRALLRSSTYWAVTAVMIALGGLGTILVFGEALSVSEMFIVGAALPALFSKIVSAIPNPSVRDRPDVPAPERANEKVSIGEIFLAS
jgi:hypothetical protein